MLENIIKSISALAFILCSLVISGVSDTISESPQSAPDAPTKGIERGGEIVCAAGVDSETEESYSPVGVWDGFGVRYEFSSGGRLTVGKTVMRYTYENGILTVDGREVEIEFLNKGKVMKCDGRTLYRVS